MQIIKLLHVQKQNFKPNIIVVIALLLFASHFLNAQFYNLPNDYHFSLLTERNLAVKDSAVHSSVKPYIHFYSKKYIHQADSHIVFKYITEDPALDLIFYNHLINVKPQHGKYKLRVDPILNIQLGTDLADSTGEKLYTNTRGLIASAYIGNDLYCETLFAENQSFFPNYLSAFSKSTGIVPGQGRHKTFKTTGYDYAFSTGFISYQPIKQLNIQVGHGKQKIGHGYRSLLLSDNSFNYPFARFTQQYFNGKLQYTNIYAVLMNLVPASKIPTPNAERLFQKKPAAFQYLSLNATKWLNVSLFQGIIWQAGNDKNKQHVNLMYANPIIGSHAAVYGLNNVNNVLLGADLKLKLSNKINLYAQLMADDMSNTKSLGNGYGYQFGLNYFDALKIKDLFIQCEFNSVSEASYISPLGAETNQSYSHYNQGLAYTPGTGNEMMVLIDRKWKRLFWNFKYQNQLIKTNGANNYNTNITTANIGYLINPAYNLNINLGYMNRYQKFYNFSTPNITTSYIFLSIRTSLYNMFYDF